MLDRRAALNAPPTSGHLFFLSWSTCYLKGQSLRCSLGWGNADLCAVMLYVGEGPRGSNGARSTLHRVSATPSATHNQIGPLWGWFPSRWACAHSRPLWVSPMTSPVRLGVSPAAAPTPLGVFNQRFEALFPRAGALGYGLLRSPLFVVVYLWASVGPWCATCTLPALLSATPSPALSVYLRECGATGSASGQTACPVRSTLRQSQLRHGNASPLCPGCPSPPLLPVSMNVYFLFTWCRTSLPFDFPSVLVV